MNNDTEIYVEQSNQMSTNLPTIATLPQITEESVTAAATAPKELRPKITDIFPEQEVSSTGTASNLQTPRSSVHRKSSGRVRTISGPGTDQNRFQVRGCTQTMWTVIWTFLIPLPQAVLIVLCIPSKCKFQNTTYLL